MSNNIIEEYILKTPKAGVQKFYDNFIDLSDFKNAKKLLEEEWKAFDKPIKNKYENKIKNFFKERLAEKYGSLGNYFGYENYRLLKEEEQKRSQTPLTNRRLTFSNLNSKKYLLELLESLENTETIQEMYRAKKRNIGTSNNAGIQTIDAHKVVRCLKQGKELFIASENGSLLVKPLNAFYSITAFSYAVVLLNSPVRYNLEALPNSHGTDYKKDQKYVSFGGDIKQGTFSEMVNSIISNDFISNDLEMRISAERTLVGYGENTFDCSLGTLLSLVPGIRSYYTEFSGAKSKTHPLTVELSRDVRNQNYEFSIGDGQYRPPATIVERDFPGFTISENFGRYIIKVPVTEIAKISPMIWCDEYSDLWYLENPFYPLVIPDIAIHYLILSILSNIMRYNPYEWGELLSNNKDSQILLILKNYFYIFENSFVPILIRNLSDYWPIISK